MSDFQILKRLYRDYTQKYVKKIVISVFFTIILAGSTSSVAYLLDPAIKELFIEQKKKFNSCYSWFNCFGIHIKSCLFIHCKSYNDWCIGRCYQGHTS